MSIKKLFKRIFFGKYYWVKEAAKETARIETAFESHQVGGCPLFSEQDDTPILKHSQFVAYLDRMLMDDFPPNPIVEEKYDD